MIDVEQKEIANLTLRIQSLIPQAPNTPKGNFNEIDYTDSFPKIKRPNLKEFGKVVLADYLKSLTPNNIDRNENISTQIKIESASTIEDSIKYREQNFIKLHKIKEFHTPQKEKPAEKDWIKIVSYQSEGPKNTKITKKESNHCKVRKPNFQIQ